MIDHDLDMCPDMESEKCYKEKGIFELVHQTLQKQEKTCKITYPKLEFIPGDGDEFSLRQSISALIKRYTQYTLGWSLFPKFRPGTVQHRYHMPFGIRKYPKKEFLKNVEKWALTKQKKK